METLRKFEEKAWSDNGDFEVEIKDAALGELLFAFDAAVTSGSGTVAQDAALKLLGTLEVNQNGSRVQADARLLYYLSAVYEGGIRELTAGSSATDTATCRFGMPFQRMIPGAGLDASSKVVSFKGRFRDGAYYSSGGVTVGTGSRIRPAATTMLTAPEGGPREPDWIQETVKLESASVSANSRKIENRADYLMPGLLLMAVDANGDIAATDASARDDGVAHRVTVELFGNGRAPLRLVDDIPWGVLRAETARRAGWTDADQTAAEGIVWLPLFERQGGRNADALRLLQGSHLTVTIDNASGAENGFTAVTPGAGDRVDILVPRFFNRGDLGQTGSATVRGANGRARRSNRSRNI